MTRVVALYVLLLLLAPIARVRAQEPDVDGAFAALAAAAPGEARLVAARRILELGPSATSALVARLSRPRTSTDAERRAVLLAFGADVPDEKGNFRPPGRLPAGQRPPDPDWLAELAKNPSREPALLESLEIVTTIRALAATREVAAGEAIYEFAFSPDGTAFRDECGRYLREMSPYSLPALLRASAAKKGLAYRRYAAYQLDRLDKARPAYALAAAPNDALEVAMLKAIADVKHPDAVAAVLDRCDSNSNAVRKAARQAWLAYVTGPPPPPAPKAKRKLPGGRLTEEELPLYLTYRELAIEELKRRLTQLRDGVAPPKDASAEEMTREIFAIFDQRRAARWDAIMAEAEKHAQAGDWEKVAAQYDHILVNDPMYARRAYMVKGYLELGRKQIQAGRYAEAAVTLNKALSIDPDGAQAKDIEAELHYARAMAAKATGKDVSEDLERALAADPRHESARAALRKHAQARYAWMLYAGLGSGTAAAAVLYVALRRAARRRNG